ncbi:MAG TPA: carbamoyltransferase C-terminal domain-containing protein [Planctomycetota bacterium]|jgi:carbamoyltransferase
MNVLGIAYGHNATVCLVQDGAITFCQSEERFNRIKNSTGFPAQTLDYIYRHLVPPEKIDLAVLFQESVYGYLFLRRYGFKAFQYGFYLDPSLLVSGLKARFLDTDVGWRLWKIRVQTNEKRVRLRDEAMAYYTKELRLPREKIAFLNHHLAHAYSVVPAIPNGEETLVFTLDGVGDWTCATVSRVKSNRVEVLSKTDHQHSLGYYYAETTGILGMRIGEHEFKVMGLAPYSSKAFYEPILVELRKLLTVDDAGQWRGAVKPVALRHALDKVYRFRRFDNVAGAIQALAEELIQKWVHIWIRKTGCRNIAVAGGVFLNVKACQRIAESPEVKSIFVMPSAGDETCALGAAVWGHLKAAPASAIKPLEDLYLGVSYTDAEMEETLRSTDAARRYDIETPERMSRRVAELLAGNEIVARCTGRMEFGARALGNRSILANPSDFRNVQLINDAIKCRDFWMPFAPSILEEDMPRYVLRPSLIFAPYMCITFDSTDAARRDLTAALHPKDKTLRPQAVRKSWNPEYYDLLQEFKALTGIGGVLNTSFNLHGEPNVCSPEDAIKTVDRSCLKYLALGKFLLKKRTDATPSSQGVSKPLGVV